MSSSTPVLPNNSLHRPRSVPLAAEIEDVSPRSTEMEETIKHGPGHIRADHGADVRRHRCGVAGRTAAHVQDAQPRATSNFGTDELEEDLVGGGRGEAADGPRLLPAAGAGQ